MNRKSFVPFIMAGDPGVNETKELVRRFSRLGADQIELGVPFSDPVADGPVNQRAAERALKRGVTLSTVLQIVSECRADGIRTPIVLFTYFNPLFRMGAERFAAEAARAGLTSVLVVDLPPEEASEHIRTLRAHGIGTVFLVSPTTSVERMALINEAASAFVYCVSSLGVTGIRTTVSDTLAAEMAEYRRHLRHPLIVGFGISSAEQARTAAEAADGVVVGSYLVRLLEDYPFAVAVEKIEAFTRQTLQVLNPLKNSQESVC